MKTTSLWGAPPSRYYRFMRRVERHYGGSGRLRFAVLGCADGKFVLPAARRGHDVLAIDLDATALFGGVKASPQGEVFMPGLVWRLERENLGRRVKVIRGDFARDAPVRPCEAVLTSGALQYSFNTPNPMDRMVERVKKYVVSGGFLYVDYMLPYEAKYRGRPNCPTREVWASYFPRPEWAVLSHRVLGPVRDRAHVEFPVDHYHQWGHLLAQKAPGVGQAE